jgi:phage/plasmid-associated DNA primase
LLTWIQLVPFVAKIPKLDTQLSEKLKAELPMILRWMIAGVPLWLNGGLKPPTKVTVATDEYVASADTIGHWFEERAEKWGLNELAYKGEAYVSYKIWAEAAGLFVMDKNRFCEQVATYSGGPNAIREDTHGKSSAKCFYGFKLKANPLPRGAAYNPDSFYGPEGPPQGRPA